MQIHTTLESLRKARLQCACTALVATMGNLHQGHIALVNRARERAQNVIASVFVNRLQFGPNEDFERYPRTLEADCAKLEAAGVDHVFAPTEREMYPQPQSYHIAPAPAHVEILEGACRPGHFSGVATVVLKLLNITAPDVAVFGKKDYQQLMVVSNMVAQLALPVEIVPVETLRAEDGLALSSRNSYLSAQERQEAPRLYRQLQSVASDARAASAPDHALLETRAMDQLRQHGWLPDYVSVRRRSDLQAPTSLSDPLVVLAAARLGGTRLIDNLEF